MLKNIGHEAIDKKISALFDRVVDLPEYPNNKMVQLLLAMVLSLVPAIVYAVAFVAGVVFFLRFAFVYAPFPLADTGIFYVIFYLFVVVLCTSITIFMLRPFLNSRIKSDAFLLSRKHEPRIHQIIDGLSISLKIPHQTEFVIGSDVIVDVFYASFRDYKNRKLTLKLGLPLIRTLKLNEFIALSAHEYARLINPRLSFCYFIIRALRSWFYRTVNNEDGWSDNLAELVQKHTFLKVFMIPVQIGVSIVNRIFQLFFIFQEFVSKPAIDQVEFYADVVQAHFLGPDGFAVNLQHLVKIDQSYHASLEKVLSTDKVPPDISDLIYKIYMEKDTDSDQTIEMTTSEEFNSWHMLPKSEKRLEEISSHQITPIPVFDIPLIKFFSDPQAIGYAVSASIYSRFDIQSEPEKDVPADDMPINMDKYEEVLFRFTSGVFRRDVVWSFSEVEKFSQLPERNVLPFLRKVIVSIRHNIPDFTRYTELSADYQKQRRHLHFYQWLIKDGAKQRPSVEHIEKVKHDVRTFQEKYGEAIEKYKKFYGVRVSAATALGRDSKAYKNVNVLIILLSRVSKLQPKVDDVKVKCSTLEQLMARRDGGEALHKKAIYRLTRMVLSVVGELENLLKSLPESLIKEFADIDIDAGKIQPTQGISEGAEALAIKRFRELLRYYEAYNVALSAKLAQFVEHVEKKRGIESVTTVSLKDV